MANLEQRPGIVLLEGAVSLPAWGTAPGIRKTPTLFIRVEHVPRRRASFQRNAWPTAVSITDAFGESGIRRCALMHFISAALPHELLVLAAFCFWLPCGLTLQTT